ncbi:hypothetical protein HME9302_00208 [Alteripontixanthobacter maritimus]|uniref:Thioesterase domain-containing protein n=1 Tax=Alteripontixanthobacter maritimus TaxID=2161824 RepID=A0A369Q298_9SPHN|nr:acyl-CoA thioesterase [Alteripontixanthobacter maritimus]RDC59031.1 hypothetical protein HME9302_00208 [Alteripontixanthobacter maritimus]
MTVEADHAPRFSRKFTARPEHIDELGHVNNAVWVQWIQDLATQHWYAAARPQDRDAYIWVVVRHEIDYRGNIRDGESVTGETFIPDGPKGARFGRAVEFRNASGKIVVSALTMWAMLDAVSLRPQRIGADIAAPFLESTAP